MPAMRWCHAMVKATELVDGRQVVVLHFVTVYSDTKLNHGDDYRCSHTHTQTHTNTHKHTQTNTHTHTHTHTHTAMITAAPQVASGVARKGEIDFLTSIPGQSIHDGFGV